MYRARRFNFGLDWFWLRIFSKHDFSGRSTCVILNSLKGIYVYFMYICSNGRHPTNLLCNFSVQRSLKYYFPVNVVPSVIVYSINQ